MLRTALTLATRGIHVFPCVPRGKAPACEHGCKAATTDGDTIRQWWHTEPHYNIGIACGSVSGIFAVDIDSYEAEKRLAKLEDAHDRLPPTVEVITSRGRHLYFRYPTDRSVRNSAGKIAPGIDTRGDGGYTLAPPSIHPSGRAYAWSVDSANRFAIAPPWLLDRINGHASSKQPTPAATWRSLMGAGVDEGQRNDAAARLCGYFLRRNCDAFLVLDLLLLWNASRCRPPLADEEIEYIVSSVAGAEIKRRAGNGR
jgi:Bifunctional DNA primase/polymerase, N-terminal/Primase C terminal 1 (PriCT-1)